DGEVERRDDATGLAEELERQRDVARDVRHLAQHADALAHDLASRRSGVAAAGDDDDGRRRNGACDLDEPAEVCEQRAPSGGIAEGDVFDRIDGPGGDAGLAQSRGERGDALALEVWMELAR